MVRKFGSYISNVTKLSKTVVLNDDTNKNLQSFEVTQYEY